MNPSAITGWATSGWLCLLVVVQCATAVAQEYSPDPWAPPSQPPPSFAYPSTYEPDPFYEDSTAAEAIYADAEEWEDSPWCWHVRPKGFLYSTYWASAAEPRMATHLVKIADMGRFQDSHIGGRLGIVRFGPKDQPEGWQLDVLGGAKLRQDWDEGLDVVSTDYRYDILATYGAGRRRLKLGFYHVSSHAGDEFLLKNPDFDRLNYFRDVLVAGFSIYPVPPLRLYAEAGWAFDYDVSEPWEFQFGADFGPAYPTGAAGGPFAAINTHLREDVDFGGNLALQIGWAWTSENTDGVLRSGLYYYSGRSPQFSFYAENEEQVGWGLWYDY